MQYVNIDGHDYPVYRTVRNYDAVTMQQDQNRGHDDYQEIPADHVCEYCGGIGDSHTYDEDGDWCIGAQLAGIAEPLTNQAKPIIF